MTDPERRLAGLKAARRGQIPAFIVMDVVREANALAAAGAEILHLEVGQPATGAPQGVVEAAKAALGVSALGYTEALGIAPLRARISRHYRDFYGIEIGPERIVVTVGASGAFVLAFLACFEAGDRVALATPAYPAYRNILKALDIEVVEVEAQAADRFQPTPALLDQVEGRLDGLIVASPSNPAGTMLGAAELAELAAYCRRRGIRLISDEIYHGLTYGVAATTAASIDADAIVVNSFSKYFSMTGWRLGWMVVPEPLLRSVECLAQNLVISPPSLSQVAGIAAFDCAAEIEDNIRRYAENRALLLHELPKAGFESFAPADGAFYLYADVGHMTTDSMAFCRRILAETGVAITPGIDFDPRRDHHTVRFSFAGSTADMDAAAKRLQAWRHR